MLADAGYWHRLMRKEVEEAVNMRHNLGVAKNIVLFLGDGKALLDRCECMCDEQVCECSEETQVSRE